MGGRPAALKATQGQGRLAGVNDPSPISSEERDRAEKGTTPGVVGILKVRSSSGGRKSEIKAVFRTEKSRQRETASSKGSSTDRAKL